VERDTTYSIFTERAEAKKVMLSHFKGKTSALHSERFRKRTVPQDAESNDEQFSTIFRNTELPKASDLEEEILPISYFESKPL
jgi:hypothetical protein